MSLLMTLGIAATTMLAQSPSQVGEVRLHIETDSPKVELYRVTSDGVGSISTFTRSARVDIVHFQRECFAPCDMTLSEPRSDFFVAGRGINPSERFSLLGLGEDVTLRVKPGSTVTRALGWTSTVVGITALSLVAAVVLVEGVDSLGKPTLGGGMSKETTWMVAGAGGGAVLLGGGLTLLAFSGTDVELLPTPKPAARREVL
ncbi:hypothetical protein JRI60_00090 [Archangium violaceum]|uniref:hypothetical protein n=1 Tax=Archangium violaceum TaxID=83451 RepID=UPI001951D0B8|nr:hypothetical protein [Archangium violaceum]QRN97531.1 hypothetical protein JRI60_00090 [Archangium violaceum]